MRLCSNCGKPCNNDPKQPCPSCGYKPVMLRGFPAFAPELSEESEGFEASYFNTLSKLEAGSFWFNSRNRLLSWALRRYFPTAKDFLEIGCGTGFVLSGIRSDLPYLTLSGSEVFTAGLAVAAQRLPGIELFQMDARRIPFEEHFDVIGAFDVLEHIQEDELVLAQIRSAVRPGGGIILTVPQHAFLWSKMDEYAHHARRYSATELTAKVERAGFEVLKITSFVSLLLPLMFAARLKQRLWPGQFDAGAEFNINRVTNAFLGGVMRIERVLIRLGVSLPAGGSLLLTARRV